MGFGLFAIWAVLEIAFCCIAGSMATNGHWGPCISFALLAITLAIIQMGMLIAQTIKNKK